MLEFRTGNMLTADADALVNTVNCVGVMGRGIAAQFKRAWPENFRHYAAACRRGEVQPGCLLVFETGTLIPPKLIVNFPTKRHWRDESRLEDIESGLSALIGEITTREIRTIAVPALGAGLGGLPWSEVRARIESAALCVPEVRFVVYEPLEQTTSTPELVRGSFATPESTIISKTITEERRP
ncbi:MAG: macro domain-containing protein [Candidatus Eisenbacteria bacterium]|nr:macro domain-containing protein [Candidatus Eisenbacteria bacterium]